MSGQNHFFRHDKIAGFLIICIATVCASCSNPADRHPVITPTFSPEQTATQISSTPVRSETPTPTTVPATATPIPIDVPSVPFQYFQMSSALGGWAGGRIESVEHLWHTDDGGLTWMDVTAQTMELCSIGRGDIRKPFQAWVGVCGLPDQGTGLARTTDGGKTWTLVNDSMEEIFEFEIRFYGDQEGMMRSCGAAAGSLICDFKETHDGGVTWSRIPIVYDPDGISPLFPGEVRACNICGDAIYIDPQRLIVVAGNLAQDADEQIRLQITTNWGEDWETLYLPLPSGQYARSWIRPHSPEFYSDSIGILPVDLLTEDGNQAATAFYGSSDGGLSWTFLSLVESESDDTGGYLVRSSLVIVTNEDIFLRCGEDLCVTHDGALSWQRLSSNLNFGDSEADNYAGWLDFGDAMTGWAFVETNEDERTLWRTTDGGLSWQLLTPVFIGRD